jgi:peptide subunit release factor 1 (eRF1)
MITREDIRELAEFKGGDTDCAISFYFQPTRPSNKSHRDQSILAKDLVQQALREAEKDGRNGCAREDLQKILEAAGDWVAHRSQAKAVFACGSRKIWREFNLSPQLAKTQLFVNRRFRLKELAEVLGVQPRLRLVLLDRHRARFFDLHLDELKEGESLFGPLPRRGRGDGFAGVDGGHAERSASDEVLHHFKNVADSLKQGLERGAFDQLAVGSHDNHYRDLEAQLHPYVKKRLLGHFAAEVGGATEQQVRQQGERILNDSLAQHRQAQVKEVLSQAKSNRRGVTGLRRVLRSLEMGEVQVLLMADDYTARAVECSNCGHLDAHIVRFCSVCGSATRELEDVCDAIVRGAIRRDVELMYVKEDPEFDHVGGIAALLRFRADGKNKKAAVAS